MSDSIWKALAVPGSDTTCWTCASAELKACSLPIGNVHLVAFAAGALLPAPMIGASTLYAGSGVGVIVGVGVAVGVWVGVAVEIGVFVGVFVGVRVGVWLGVKVGVKVGVTVDVGPGVGVAIKSVSNTTIDILDVPGVGPESGNQE